MSLIHDALKRAKLAEKQSPPPDSSGPSFRGIDPGQSARRGIGIALPAALAVVALLGLFLVWRFSQSNVRARSGETTAQTAAEQSKAPAPQSPVASSSAVVPSQPVPTPVATPPPEVATTPTTNSTPDSATNVAATVAAPEPAPPKPAPLRLQAILYHPQHPSAVVSGKTLFLGDRIGDLHLVALDKESATLAGAGKTNVLTLDQ